MFVGTMSATKEGILGFDTVSDDFAPTMLAIRRERMDSTFETIKKTGLVADKNFERFIVIVSANFAFHNVSFRKRRPCPV